MRKPPWKRLALWTVFGVIGILIGMDVALRLFWGLGKPLLYRNDPDTGYIVAPSQDVVRDRCHNDINAFSMRSPEVISPKPKDEFRLLMIGDSITYGTTYVDQPDIFTSILDRDLPSRLGEKVEVFNASAGGWGPPNELGYLRSRGTFGANMVVFVLNTGDLIQSFSISVVGHSPAFPDHDPSCALVELIDHYILPRLRRLNIADAGSQAELPDIARDTPPNLKILGQARAIANAAGAYFAILYIPAQGSEWAPYLPGLAMLKNWCGSNHVDLIDLTSAYSKYPPQQLAFDNGHGHPSPFAHALIAKVVGDYLSNKPWLSAGLPLQRQAKTPERQNPSVQTTRP